MFLSFLDLCVILCDFVCGFGAFGRENGSGFFGVAGAGPGGPQGAPRGPPGGIQENRRKNPMAQNPYLALFVVFLASPGRLEAGIGLLVTC